MLKTMIRYERSLSVKILYCFICLIFVSTGGTTFAGTLAYMPPPTQLITTSVPSEMLRPVGLRFNKNNPLFLSFILNNGSEKLSQNASREQLDKIMRYFLGALTMPGEDLWVNLSPYEDDIICPNTLGETELGHNMLAQDYLLKQLTASLMYPESETGKKFWKAVYQKVYEKTGDARIPVRTFNKVWIVPQDIVIYQRQNQALIGHAYLKVLSEDDYYALSKVQEKSKNKKPEEEEINKISSQVMRDIIIPAIEKEVNEGKQFAALRQIYNTVILAQWFKKKLKDSALAETYFDQNTLYGAQADNVQDKEKIFDTYMTAFKKGVYNYTKNDSDPANKFKAMRRQYISGGVELNVGENISVVGEFDDDRETGIFGYGTVAARSDAPVAMNNNLGRPPSGQVEKGQLALARAPMPAPVARQDTARHDTAQRDTGESKVLPFTRAPKTDPVRLAPLTSAIYTLDKNDQLSAPTQEELAITRGTETAVIALRPAADREAIARDIQNRTQAERDQGIELFENEKTVADPAEALQAIAQHDTDQIRAMHEVLSTGDKTKTSPEMDRHYAAYESSALALRDFGVSTIDASKTALDLARVYSSGQSEESNLKATERVLQNHGLGDKVDAAYIMRQAMNPVTSRARETITPKQREDIDQLRSLAPSIRLGSIDAPVARERIAQAMRDRGLNPTEKDITDIVQLADQGETQNMMRSVINAQTRQYANNPSNDNITMRRQVREIVAAASRTVVELKEASRMAESREPLGKVSEDIKAAVAYDLAAALPKIDGIQQDVLARHIVDSVVNNDIGAANEAIGIGFTESKTAMPVDKTTPGQLNRENITQYRQITSAVPWVQGNIRNRIAVRESRGLGIGTQGDNARNSGTQGRAMRDQLKGRSGKAGGLDLNAGNMSVKGEDLEFTKEDTLDWLKRFAIKGFNYEILSYNPR
jgi:hypothetical protein